MELAEWADIIVFLYDVASAQSLIYCEVLFRIMLSNSGHQYYIDSFLNGKDWLGDIIKY